MSLLHFDKQYGLNICNWKSFEIICWNKCILLTRNWSCWEWYIIRYILCRIVRIRWTCIAYLYGISRVYNYVRSISSYCEHEFAVGVPLIACALLHLWFVNVWFVSSLQNIYGKMISSFLNDTTMKTVLSNQ